MSDLHSPEPRDNPNGTWMVDPPAILRHLMKRMFEKVVNPKRVASARMKAEAARVKAGEPHVVEYFHQYDDPYSHLAAQTLDRLTDRYDVQLIRHDIRASGGKNQPELDKLDVWARRDAALIAPHYGLTYSDDFVGGQPDSAELDAGSARLAELGHYSGAMFYYGGEWYWGVDRLFYLERRLRDLGVCHDPSLPFICPRPDIDVSGVDASGLTLDFYPSLNSPYTSIIFDKTITTARECGIQLNHKPVLPMIMRGVPATREKGMYIMFDTKREGEFLGAPFGPVMTPIGEPVRQIYSLLPWAKEQGRDVELISASLRLAFAEGVALHKSSGQKRAVEDAGLDWNEAKALLGNDSWKSIVTEHQREMTEDLGLWGVPSYRLSGGDGKEDLCVWGQDRLWLIAAEIRRRAGVLA